MIAGAIGVFIPYIILMISFEYPDILRQDTSIILTKFHEGGSKLILTWFLFAIIGTLLIPAYILLGQKLENKNSLIRIATTLGIIGLIVQIVGLLRWTFVVPALATTFANATDEATRAAAIVSFKTIHQYGGVLLGEHLGQLFTICWTVLVCITFEKLKLFPKWFNWLGILSAFIYLLAQAELFATVIPGFPTWELAGLIGSTLWLIWLIILGCMFLRKNYSESV
jgi:hypothetical protein